MATLTIRNVDPELREALRVRAARHERSFGIDAFTARRGGLRLGRGAAACRAYTTSVNKAEILYGIAALPDGRRRAALAAAAEAMFTDDFAGRVLPFDEEAAVHYTEIVAARRREGRPIEALDAQIAATTRIAGAELATRDVGDFAGCGLALVNPWEAT